MKKEKKKGMQLSWVVVSDLKKAKHFFTHVLGLQCHTEDANYQWMEFSAEDGAHLGVAGPSPHSPIKPGSNAIVTITVDNLDATLKDLKSKKAKLIGDICEVPGHVKMQLLSDDDGNLFQVVEQLD